MHDQELTLQKNSLKAWLLAARPKTLAPSFAPIFSATLLAYYNHYSVHWDLSLFALLASLCIHIGTNYINDSQDSTRKKDTGMRLGPLRMSQIGALSRQQVYYGGILSFSLGLTFGIPLVLQGGYPLLLALLASILAGYLYTGGPYPLGYHGWGEAFVMIFFGWVITDSLFYIQTGTITTEAWLLGTQMGLLSTSLFAMTSFRDIVEDTATNKKTLAVRFGPTFSRVQITVTTFLPFALNLYWLTKQAWLICFLPFITLPLAYYYVYNVWQHNPSRLYVKFIGMICLLQLSFGLLLSLGFFCQNVSV